MSREGRSNLSPPVCSLVLRSPRSWRDRDGVSPSSVGIGLSAAAIDVGYVLISAQWQQHYSIQGRSETEREAVNGGQKTNREAYNIRMP